MPELAAEIARSGGGPAEPERQATGSVGAGGCDAGRSDREIVPAGLGALAQMDAAALRHEWRRLFRTQPPKLSREMLELAVAWKLQERSLGGLSAVAKRRLAEAAGTLATKSEAAQARRARPKPGARLLRRWGGEIHEIAVVEDGFTWRGRTWTSLSAIARAITGARWSGPRFFGLAQPRAAGADRRPAAAADG